MTDPKRKQKGPEIKAPYIPDHEIPDPPVPNRAWTEMSLGNFAPGEMKNEDGELGNFEISND